MKWVALVFLSALCHMASAGEARVLDDGQTRAEIEGFAARLPYMSLGAVLYCRLNDRIVELSVPEKYRAHRAVFEKLQNTNYSTNALKELLRSPNARVRTVAAVALFDREDPHVLPALVELSRDQEKTFDDHIPISVPVFARSDKLDEPRIELPMKEQTVGDLATWMVRFYLQPAGYHYGIEQKSQNGFAHYWAARKERPYCASWFAVQLARTCGGSSPTPGESIPRIRALRERIDKIPADDRAWILLWLNGEAGSDALVTEPELLDFCRELGPQKLMQMLQKKIPSNDPDLQSRASGNWMYTRMMLFVLKHAITLLRAEDSAALLEYEKSERKYVEKGISDPFLSAHWAVAAATLKPDNAREILVAAIPRFHSEYQTQDRSLLHATLWRLAGEPESERILKWFFAEEPERGSSSTGCSEFIKNVARQPAGKTILARIIEDEKLDQLEWQALEALVIAVNGLSPAPLVSDDELRKPWHPTGLLHFHANAKEAEAKYPKETQELRRIFGDWRQRLRNGVKGWRVQ